MVFYHPQSSLFVCYAASPQYQPPPTYNPEFGPVATPKTMCAASAARAQRVTATTSSHVNGCSPACRLSARASWRPQYPLLPQCTWRSPLATENGRVCRVVDRGRQYHQPRPRFNTATTNTTPLVQKGKCGCDVACGRCARSLDHYYSSST